MTGPAITFDAGALIALERRKERAMKVYTHARDRGLIVAAFAVQRTGIIYTSDVGDFEALQTFFPALRAFAI